MSYADRKIEALNSLTATIQKELPESKKLSKDPKVLASTMLRHVRFNDVQKEVLTLIEIIINEVEDED